MSDSIMTDHLGNVWVIKSVADKEINELKIKLETVLLDENKLSDSYVRIRETIGAMSPPSLEPEALYAYVEKCVTEHSTSSVEKFGEDLLSDLRGDCWDEHDIQYIRLSLTHYIKKLRGGTVTSNELTEKAISLYKPPFTFRYGYIHDGSGHVVADNNVENDDQLLRIRGWGRILYMENPEALQDEVGRIVAEALTEYWSRKQP